MTAKIDPVQAIAYLRNTTELFRAARNGDDEKYDEMLSALQMNPALTRACFMTLMFRLADVIDQSTFDGACDQWLQSYAFRCELAMLPTADDVENITGQQRD